MLERVLDAGSRIESIRATDELLAISTTHGHEHRVDLYGVDGTHHRRVVAVSNMRTYPGDVVFSRDRRTLYSTYGDSTLVEIDVATGEVRSTVALPASERDPTFRPTGGPMYVAEDGTLYVESFGHVHAWNGATFERLHGWMFAGSPQRLVASSRLIWAVGTALVRYSREAQLPEVKFKDSCPDLAYLAAHDRIVVAHYDGTVEVFGPDGSSKGTVRVGPAVHHGASIVPLRGGQLAAVSCADHRIAIIAPGDVAPRARIEGEYGQIWTLEARGEVLWIGDNDGRLWRLDLADEAFAVVPKKAVKPKQVNHWATWGPYTAVATEDGFVSCAGTNMARANIRDVCAWRRDSVDAVAHRSGGKLGVNHLVSLGRNVICDDGNQFAVLDAKTLETVAKLEHKKAEGLAVSPDRGLVVTTSSAEIKVWSTETWKQVGGREGEAVPKQAVAWLAGEVIVFRHTNDSFGTIAASDLKRRATKRLGVISAFATHPQAPIVALVVDIGTPTKPDLVLRLWNAITDKVIELPRLAHPNVTPTAIAALDETSGTIAMFDFEGKPQRQFELGRPATRLVVGERHAAVLAPSLIAIDLSTGATTELKPRAGNVQQLVSVDGDAIVVLTTAGRLEWLATASLG